MYLRVDKQQFSGKKKTNFFLKLNFRFLGLQIFFLFGGLVFFMFSFLVLKRMHSAKQNQEKMNICTNEKQKLKDFTTKSLPLDGSKWQTGVRTDRKTVRGKKSAEETATVQNHLWVIIPRRLYSFWANIKVLVSIVLMKHLHVWTQQICLHTVKPLLIFLHLSLLWNYVFNWEHVLLICITLIYYENGRNMGHVHHECCSMLLDCYRGH